MPFSSPIDASHGEIATRGCSPSVGWPISARSRTQLACWDPNLLQSALTGLCPLERVLIVRYEDLVAAPEEHQASIATFLEVANEPVPLDPLLVRDHPLFPERETWKSNALGEVTTDRVTAWDTGTSEQDLAVIDAAVGPNLSHHGYGAETSIQPEPMDAASLSAVTAFRQWYAMTTALTGLPIT